MLMQRHTKMKDCSMVLVMTRLRVTIITGSVPEAGLGAPAKTLKLMIATARPNKNSPKNNPSIFITSSFPPYVLISLMPRIMVLQGVGFLSICATTTEEARIKISQYPRCRQVVLHKQVLYLVLPYFYFYQETKNLQSNPNIFIFSLSEFYLIPNHKELIFLNQTPTYPQHSFIFINLNQLKNFYPYIFFICQIAQLEDIESQQNIIFDPYIENIFKTYQTKDNIYNQYHIMNGQCQKLVKDIERSLDRLHKFASGKQLQMSLPAFSYSAHLLEKYAKQVGAENTIFEFFDHFRNQIQIFKTFDYAQMKQHHQDIINEILNIVDSEMFINCMRPDIRTSRSIVSEAIHIEELGLENGDGQKNEEKMKSSRSLKSISMSKTASIFENLWSQLTVAYEEHRIDEAFDLKNKIRQGNYKLTPEQEELLSTIQLEYKTMMEFYVQFDQEGWILDKEENGVTLQYKLFQEEKQIAIRIQSEFNISVENFLAILSEMDLFGNYVPFCYDSREQKVVSRNEKIGSSKIYIPLLTDRETYFYAAGYDRVKHNGTVFLYSKTINTDNVYQEKYKYKVPEKSNLVRLEYKFFIVEYYPINKERARVRLASKIDMKLNFLPQFIINASARKFAFNYFKNIIEVNRKFKGSKWEEKIKENGDFYLFFKRKIHQYLG